MPGLHSDSRFRLCKDISCRSVSKTGGLQPYCPELQLCVIATLSERRWSQVHWQCVLRLSASSLSIAAC